MTTMKVLGTTDEVTTCDCCGRKDLKDTVAFEREDGAVVYFGCVCAARALKTSAKDIRIAASAADKAKADAARAVAEIVRKAEDAKWQAFLDAKTAGAELNRDHWGKVDRFHQIQFLGGYPAAKALYDAEMRT